MAVFAHSLPDNPDRSAWQPLEAHLESVAGKADAGKKALALPFRTLGGMHVPYLPLVSKPFCGNPSSIGVT